MAKSPLGSGPAMGADKQQRAAADPQICAFVLASAGSGKTRTLTNRVLRLLLDGAAPERILCITYTKAGAAEIRNRIDERLSRWAALGEADLRVELYELCGYDPDPDLVAMARSLLARVLDAPGGMRIETIHGFCQSLLRRFPLEAGVVPHFNVIDERQALSLQAEARADMLAAAGAGGEDSPLGRALAYFAASRSEDSLAASLAEFLRERRLSLDLEERRGGVDALAAAMRAALGLARHGGEEDMLRAACADDGCDLVRLRAAAAALAEGSAAENGRAAILRLWLDADGEGRAARFDEYAGLFLKQDGDILADRNLATKKTCAAMPDILEVLKAEARRLRQVAEKRRAFAVLAGSMALATLGLDCHRRYAAAKRMRAALDYDDLIQRARDLLLRPGLAAWVLYKLDGGVDHILVDEAQDTNPAQWDIVRKLTEDWVSGQGADAERRRSLFVVGDFKQSIFGFQGARPDSFLAERDYYRRRLMIERGLKDARPEFKPISLAISFRSSPAILAVVDSVFTGETGIGVREGEAVIEHLPARANAAGEVEIWPLAIPVAAEALTPWPLPRSRASALPPFARLAEAMAERIAAMVTAEERLPSRGRPIRAGDILVLVRQRNEFVPALEQALKARRIEVSGSDRLRLLEDLAVRDLVAFLDFLLLPDDDLNLAALLKSPLLGFDEEALFRLCRDRGGLSLWRRLGELAATAPDFAAAHDLLRAYRDKADRLTPHELLADLLSAGNGRRQLQARLGTQIGEVIDELLNLALAYEAQAMPASLQGFVRWLRASEAEIKREMAEEGAGQVRIMTVHGAKGLEAPVVFLADYRRQLSRLPGLFWHRLGDGALPLWCSSRKEDCALTKAARAAAEARQAEEENRLLYVALTRAADRLYVCGWRRDREIAARSWLDRVAEALGRLPGTERKPAAAWRESEVGWEGDFLAYRDQGSEAIVEEALWPDLPPAAEEDAEWLFQSATPEGDPPRPLTPSRPLEAEPALISPLAATMRERRFRRGLDLHKLFQILPGLAPARRRDAGAAWLRSAGYAEAEVDAMLREVIAVLDHPDFAPLFGPGSRAEIPIAAALRDAAGRSVAIEGQIDRLLVTEREVAILDYKSNRPPAMRPEQVAPAYLRQLAVYEQAIARIYPGKAIRCYLLWTATPLLMEIAGDLLAPYRPAP